MPDVISMTATFLQNSGQPATGLALADIDLYLTSSHRTTGAISVIWDGTQNPTVEVTNTGKYIRILATGDMDTYIYHLAANYTGATVLDSDWAVGSIAKANADMTALSGDVSAADALEAMLDGTGGTNLTVNQIVGDITGNLSGSVGSVSNPNSIADQVWNETIADHLGVGSTGEALDNISAGASPDQIADAVWNEAIADHLAAGSTGNKLNSISGAVFPAGAIAFTYTITDSVTSNPIEGVEVWISTDDPATNIVWKGDTDAFGIARDVNGNLPNLDAGAYYFWRQKSGYLFSDPDTEVVS